MATELVIPAVGESITEVVIAKWLKNEGDPAAKDESLAEIETDKVTFALPAPGDGVLTAIKVPAGATAEVGAVACLFELGASPAKSTAAAVPAANPDGGEKPTSSDEPSGEPQARAAEPRITPAAARALAEHGLNASDITPSGPGGRLLKEDVLRALEGKGEPVAASKEPTAKQDAGASMTAAVHPPSAMPAESSSDEEVVPLSPLRLRVAQRLVQASTEMALLTTFNEADMSGVVALRKQWQEAFQTKYGIKLGFMSFFVKAVVEALKAVPQVNAELRGDSLVYHHRYDLGVAIGGGKGLVVPVLRGADRLSFAQVEQAIADFAQRAAKATLTLDDLTGGTFTISNGGVYGSMLSTPIVNPPQCGILGLHAIQDRPVARDGQVVIRPMMYLALSYDHRIVDGREAVTFLRRIKEVIEDPARLFLEV